MRRAVFLLALTLAMATLPVLVVPKGQAGRHAYISEFIEEAKASGLVKQLVERAGLQGVQVAPAGSKGMP